MRCLCTDLAVLMLQVNLNVAIDFVLKIYFLKG